MMRTSVQRSTRSHRRARIAPISVVFLLSLLAACGGGSDDTASVDTPVPITTAATTTTTTAVATSTTIARPSTPVDQLVMVGGARLHLRCSGVGDATVLLIAGFGAAADSWAAVEPSVSRSARVCAYDRFGTGTSDPPPRSQTFVTEAKDLRALLASAGEAGPYIVVGHSFGGPEAVAFTSLHHDEVNGLLLLEASPTTWTAAVCAVADNGSAAARGFRDACTLQADPANNSERLDGPAAFAELATITSLGDLPMIVATAPDRGIGVVGLPAADIATLNGVWNSGQDRWVSLSSSARLVVVQNTGHNIQVDQPAVVIAQIAELLG